MARMTRKVWVGIGAFMIANAPAADAAAQGSAHGGHHQTDGKAAAGAPASGSAAEGGEAYLTDGGPKDTRIRFYRDIALIRGHLRIGGQLITRDLWDEALPHFLHPTEELYGLLEKYIKLHDITPFGRDLQVLAQAVKAKRKGAYEQRLKIVDRRLASALDAAKRFMTPPVRTFTVRSAIEVLRVAQSEYEASIEDGKFTKPVEYQDSRGFVLEAEHMIESLAKELAGIDAEGLAKVRAGLSRLKAAWPDAMPPPAPLMDAGEVSSIVSDIELHAARF